LRPPSSSKALRPGSGRHPVWISQSSFRSYPAFGGPLLRGLYSRSAAETSLWHAVDLEMIFSTFL
jgi:hypothetical protein